MGAHTHDYRGGDHRHTRVEPRIKRCRSGRKWTKTNQTGSGVYINVNLPVQFIPPSLFSLYNVLEREALQLLSSSPSSSPTNTTTEVRWLPVAPPYLNLFRKLFTSLCSSWTPLHDFDTYFWKLGMDSNRSTLASKF